jgi:protein TonB
MQRWASTIRKRIEARKAYPAAAKGAQGTVTVMVRLTVTVRLTVSRAGQLLGVAVVQSSGVAALDKAAVRAVQTARFPAAPEGMADDSASFALPMKFAD